MTPIVPSADEPSSSLPVSALCNAACEMPEAILSGHSDEGTRLSRRLRHLLDVVVDVDGLEAFRHRLRQRVRRPDARYARHEGKLFTARVDPDARVDRDENLPVGILAWSCHVSSCEMARGRAGRVESRGGRNPTL